MARPRKITDEQLLAAAESAIARLGPAFTLADVASDAGVTAGTVVHRFGSKHGLLIAMIDAAVESARTSRRAGDGRDLVATIGDAIVERYAPLDDPSTAANHLAQLGVDLADEDLRGRLATLHATIEAGLEPLVRRAMDAGMLPGAPAVPVATRILAALADGTAMRWSSRPRGRLGDRMRTDLDAVLAGWAGQPNGRVTTKPGAHA
ncbi:MAG: TetR/AcrR family transcriptional regulator [Kutzneria sp.]|nr:TetR/AcrR family transcriptional regulator [Kutzneria sp.]MBV9847246.1 TetR/AcrR family transcriptional regulator [Kutzneria sp.]